MAEFFNSKFVRDLQNGKLPPVEVVIPTQALYQIALTMFFTGLALIVSYKIFKHL